MTETIEQIPALLPKGKYFYGIIRAEGDHDLGSIGVRGTRVYTVGFKNSAALVSDHPLTEIKPLRDYLNSHHEVIKQAIKKFTIIPVAFGHTVRSTEEIRRLLEMNYREIDQELRRLGHRVEMGLKILWDVDNIFEYFVNRDRELRDFRDRIFGRSREPTREEKIELGRLFESKLNRERERHTEKVLKVLSIYTVDVRLNRPTDEKMVMNGVFLVEKGKEGFFEEKLHRAAALFDGNFAFDYSGPWAPHNFIKLQITELGTAPSPRQSQIKAL